MNSWKTDYPARYYAYSNTVITVGGYPSVGWVDVDIFTNKPGWLPAASDMVALTASEWSARSTPDQIIKDGKVQTYVALTTAGVTTTTSAAATTSAAS